MNKLLFPRLRIALTVLAGVLIHHAAHAADGTWTNNANANWSDTTRWLNGIIADGIDATANFNAIDVTANRTVTINTTSRTLGTLNLTDTTLPNFQWIIAASGGASLILSNTLSTPTINV